MNHLSIRLWRAIKSQPVTTSSGAELRRSSKALPKAKLAPKKVMVTVWWSAAHLIHCNFLNPGGSITSEKYAQQINERHWKRKCLQPALVNRMNPNHNDAWQHVTQPMFQKLNELGYEVLPHQPYSPDLSPTDYPWLTNWLTNSSSISTTFCRENASTTSRRQKMLSKSSWNPETWTFYATGIK